MASVLLLAALLAAGPAAPAGRTPCLQVSDSNATDYTPVDDHTIVIRSFRRWWKLTTTPSSLLTQPDVALVNDIHGPPTLCSPLDFQLQVVEHGSGAREGLIAQSFTAITPDEGKRLLKSAHGR